MCDDSTDIQMQTVIPKEMKFSGRLGVWIKGSGMK
uniref:Uncharacterized protein n=1 Tax=Anguilla anguilla TaxID=7936 RepID=A0A0E9TJW1_ANGAN